jgi:hypothetical protein
MDQWEQGRGPITRRRRSRTRLSIRISRVRRYVMEQRGKKDRNYAFVVRGSGVRRYVMEIQQG